MSSRELSGKRRSFIKRSTAISGAILLNSWGVDMNAYVSGSDIIKVGVIGCGGRGTGAAVQALRAGPNTNLVAMADIFVNQIEASHQNLVQIEDIKNRVKVPDENKFVGFDGYKHVIEQSDLVILATPPGFRPGHFEEAVKRNRHIFMEKPLASDAPGVRKIIAAGKLATKKNLKVVVGLQNRYDPAYIEMVDKLQSGAIGEILSSSCYYMKGEYEIIPRSEVNTELEFQIKNWHFFNWLWAGAPAGLQIHNTDIVNWVKQSYPIKAQGIGGRAMLEGPDTGELFDHYYIEYTYDDGTIMHSQIKLMNNSFHKNGTFFTGTKGVANVRNGIQDLSGSNIWKYRNKEKPNPYQVELDKLIHAIMADKPLNDTEFGAMSTMTAIMGRMAGHSSNVITWEDAFNSDLRLAPENLKSDSIPPIVPDEQGIYPYPKSGLSKVL